MTARSVTCLTCFTVVALACSTAAHAGYRTLSWTASSGAAGYHVWYGESPNTYTGMVPVGNTTTVTLDVDLDDCTRWYFSVTAYNSAGESGYSNEVSWLTPMAVDSIAPDDAGATLKQGSQLPVTIHGARFMSGATVEIDHPDWVCPQGVTGQTCQDYLDDLRNTVRLENASIGCSQIGLAATIEPTTNGARAAATGTYTVTVTNPDGSSASGEFEVALDASRQDLDTSTTYTAGRVDGLDFPHIKVRHPDDGPCICCEEATCPDFDYDKDINGDGWIDGEDLALVLGGYFFQCWDDASGSWSAAACRNHPSELSPEAE